MPDLAVTVSSAPMKIRAHEALRLTLVRAIGEPAIAAG
jgi:hypothetical protein